ncbi:MAG: YgiQ family radical SAM protein [archaeon]|nr:YgiQ family radical SAM protein [archaeon]
MEKHNKTQEQYDIIFVLGEKYFDHPLCGIAILRRLLEKNGYSVAVIEMPQKPEEVTKFGKPKLFFGISSGAIDSMVRNYTALNRPRDKDELLEYEQLIPDRAVIVYSNWIRQKYKNSPIVLGGTEATLRRLTHYDYWQNSLRKSIIFDTRADILVYGSAEKQILEIADRLKNSESLEGIEGTCIKSRELPKDFIVLPSHEEVVKSKLKFCDMQNLLSNYKNLAQKTDNFYILQYNVPEYTSEDLDEYYELPFSRDVRKVPYMGGFEFSVVTHRGCVGNCNFCSLRLTMGEKIISRSEESILREIEAITRNPHFNGIIADFGGPSANMYGLDFDKDIRKSQDRLIGLLRKARSIKGVKKIFIRSGIRYDMTSFDYIKEIVKHHISGKLKIAPEHVNEDVLKLMNKGTTKELDKFMKDFNSLGCGELTFYFMVGHPGTTMEHARELADKIKHLRKSESVQIFTPTPMTVSTCMYYTGLEPKTKKPIYVPYTYAEKKEQKRILDIPMAENRQREEDYKINEPKKKIKSRHPQPRFKVKIPRKR